MLKVILLLMLLPNLLWAREPGVQEALDLARIHQHDTSDIIGELSANISAKLKELYPDYSDAPKQSDYYQGSEQTRTNIREDAIETALHNDSAEDVKKAKQNKDALKEDDRHWVEKAADTEKVISKEASKNIQEIDENLVDCTKPEFCKTEWTKKRCLTKPEIVTNYCQRKLNIEVIPHNDTRNYVFRVAVRMHKDNHNYAGVKLNLNNGDILWRQPQEGRFSFSGTFPANAPCGNIVGNWHVLSANSTSATVDSIQYPSCQNHTMALHFISNKKLNIVVEIDLSVVNSTYEFKDHWDDGCLSFDKFLHCNKLSEECVIENETRSINGVPITRSCWEQDLSYQCKNKQLSDQLNCDTLVQDGCQLLSSSCNDPVTPGATCGVYAQTYSCPVRTCMDTSVICSSKTYCEGDDCGQSNRKPDPDFGQAVSKLSAAIDSGKNFQGGQIFSGESKSCNSYPLNTVNCCSDKGWLKDISDLFQCGQEAIELGRAREEGRATRHEVGHHQESIIRNMHVFCVFPTKLARIVQEQGRRDQLGIGFGNWKRPDCRGLTPEELQKIDFSHIDFTDYILDLQSKYTPKDMDQISKNLEHKIREKAKEKVGL